MLESTRPTTQFGGPLPPNITTTAINGCTLADLVTPVDLREGDLVRFDLASQSPKSSSSDILNYKSRKCGFNVVTCVKNTSAAVGFNSGVWAVALKAARYGDPVQVMLSGICRPRLVFFRIENATADVRSVGFNVWPHETAATLASIQTEYGADVNVAYEEMRGLTTLDDFGAETTSQQRPVLGMLLESITLGATGAIGLGVFQGQTYRPLVLFKGACTRSSSS